MHLKKKYQFKSNNNREKNLVLKLSFCSRCFERMLLLQAHLAIPSNVEDMYWLNLIYPNESGSIFRLVS